MYVHNARVYVYVYVHVYVLGTTPIQQQSTVQ